MGNQIEPKLSFDSQIEYLKSIGVSFNLCSEDEASRYLSEDSYLYKVLLYRRLFSAADCKSGSLKYRGLDFAMLKDLAGIDQLMRYVVLQLTLDIEHFEKASLMKRVTELDCEDGYLIVEAYRKQLTEGQRNRLSSELRVRRGDIYCGDIIQKYPADSMPIWALLEVVSFGTFVDICRFRATRWQEKTLLDEHYLLKKVKSLRNACAHSSAILNGIAASSCADGPRPSDLLLGELSRCGVSRKVRRQRMRNPRMLELATTLFTHGRVVPEGSSRKRAAADLQKLFARAEEHRDCYAAENPAFAAIDFMRSLTKRFGMLE